jgi:hypothetical protein
MLLTTFTPKVCSRSPEITFGIIRLADKFQYTNKQQTPWPLVHKQTILTELPPLIGEF